MDNMKKAFTLIELLVVIAIIALLVSILLPSLKTAKELARQVVCLSNNKQVGVLFAYYAEDNKGLVPPGDPNPAGQPNQWFIPLIPYVFTQYQLDSAGRLIDPSGSVIYNIRGIGWELYDCPTYKNPGDGWADSKMNVYMYSVGWTPANLYELKDAADTVLLAERDGGNWHVVPDNPAAPGYSQGTLPADRHMGKTNVLWADTHVDSRDTIELTETLEWWDRQ